MFEGIANFFKKLMKSEAKQTPSKETAKERLHLVLMQDRANVSADFLELMKQEIIEVIKKYIEVEESAIDVRLTKEVKEDGTQGAPSLYANIPILNIKNDMKTEIKKEQKESVKEEKTDKQENKEDEKKEEKSEEIKEDKQENKEDNSSENADKDGKDDKDVEEPKKEEVSEEVKEESIKEDKTEENKAEEDNKKDND